MKFKTYLIFASILLSNVLSAQDWSWAIKGEGNTDADVRSSIIDASNNVYIYGYYTGTIVIGTETLAPYGGRDIFLAKFSKGGAFLWAKRAGSTGNEDPFGIDVDSDGNVYVVGGFNLTATFNSQSIVSTGGQDVFIAKYTPGGNIAWVKNVGTGAATAGGRAYDLCISNDKLYTTGFFSVDIRLGPGDIQETYFSSAGTRNFFVAEFDTTGTINWAKHYYSGSASTNFLRIAAHDGVGIYVGGPMFTNIVIEGETYSSAGAADAFLMKLDNNGDTLWISVDGGIGDDQILSVTSDELGNVYSTGYTQGTSYFGNFTDTLNAVSTDYFISKYDANGVLQWVINSEGNNIDKGNSITYSNNKIFITGYFSDTIIIGSDTLKHSSPGTKKVYIAEYDTDGNPQNAVGVIGDALDDDGREIEVDSDGIPYVLGTFLSNPLDFGNGLTLANADAAKNVFIAKYIWNLQLSATNATCGCNGEITASAIGGAIPVTYSWSNGDATATTSNLCGGTYTVTATDNNGIALVDSVTITQAPNLTSSIGVANVSGYGGSDGAINLTVNGGTSPYTYIWSNAAITQDLSGLTAGWYKVTVTDSNGCIKLDSAEVTQPDEIILTLTPRNASCYGASNGEVDLTVIGGITPYTYAWSNLETTQDITGLTAGWYKVTVTDSLSIQKVDSIEVTSPTILSTSFVSTIPTCYGDSDGSINLTVSGGTTPYTYAWSNLAITEDISNVTAGVYYITITDDSLCQLIDTTLLQNPQQISLLLTPTPALCYNSLDGSIDLSVVSGKWPYTYAWSNLETTEDITSLGAGNYTVTVTDYDGCQKTGTTTVTDPQPINQVFNVNEPTCYGGTDGSINLTVYGGTPNYTFAWSNTDITQNISSLTAGTYTVTITDNNACESIDSVDVDAPAEIILSFSESNVSCFGKSDGEIILMVNNGTAPYTYAWTGGATTKDISGLTAGTYTVTVTDNNSCSKIDSITITEPLDITIVESITNSDCANDNIGSIDITTSGGTTPYSFFWSNNATTEDISSLDGGTYYLTVFDDNNCKKTTSYTITEPAILAATFVTTNVTCNGNSDGTIDMTVTGGTIVGDYTYLWNTTDATQDITGQPAGTYTVNISDDNGCALNTGATITEPTALTSSVASNDITCNGDNDGSATLSVSGGTAPYTYAWTGGATTQNVNNLAAGTHYVTITDANLCQHVDSAVINEPLALNIASIVTNVTCNGNNDGAIDITVTGGTSPYTYSWHNATTTEDLSSLSPGNYYLTVTDDNDCRATSAFLITEPEALALSFNTTNITCNGANDGTIDLTITGGTTAYTIDWNSGASSDEDISGLNAGTYTALITDANSCTITDSTIISEPAVLSSSTVKTDITCFSETDGTAAVTVLGGTAPYTYIWTDAQTTQSVTGLTQGTHYVTITDTNLCTHFDSVIISEPAQLDLTISISDVTCNGLSNGAIDITVTGGTTAYSFAWSNSETTENIATLIADDYTVTITDANLCTLDSTFTVSEPDSLLATFSVTDVTCNGGNDGAIDMTVTGGTTAYNITWETTETTEDIASLTANTYTVNISDANGCLFTDSVTITEPEILAFTATTTDITCFSYADGTAKLAVTGGTTPYSFAWDNSETTDSIGALDAGAYYFTITDANLCEIIDSVVINEPNEIMISYVSTDVNCNSGTDGTIDLTITNGILPLTYTWNNDSTTEDLSNLLAGVYTVTISDTDGCIKDTTITISEPNELLVSLAGTNVNCNGGADGAIDATVSGGTTPYTFAWSTTETTEDINSLTAATYSLTVTDSLACAAIETIDITEPVAQSITLSASNADCGLANGSVWIESYTGFNEPISISWNTNPVQITDTATNLTAGVYQVIITDVNGCSDSTSVIINNTTGPVVDSLLVTDVTCNGGHDGTAEVFVSGGTTPYTYAWSNSEITSSISNLSANGYDVTIIDANSCQLIESIVITQPNATTITETITDVTCYGLSDGAINITVSGGVAPYTYMWNTGETNDSLLNLTANSYSVTVTDSNACETTQIIAVNEPLEITILTGATDANCNSSDGEAWITSVSNINLPYTILWNNAATTDTISNLSVGSYLVTITGNDGCSNSASVNVSNTGAPTVSDSITNVTCYGFSDGAIDLTISGGNTPYSIIWSNTENSEDITALTANEYTVTVIDANNCQNIQTYSVEEPENLTFDFTTTDNVCYGESNGIISVNVSGGTAPYTYAWSNSETTALISNLLSGTYNLTVTDSLSCTYSSSEMVSEPTMLTATLSYTDTICFEATTNITSNVSGGTFPYSYNWSTLSTETSLSNVTAGSYTLTVSDAMTCESIVTADILENDSIYITETITDLTCNGDNSGAISISIIGGFTPHTYAWSNNATDQNISGLDAGIYSVTVSDNVGCTVIGTYTVNEPNAFVFSDSVNNVMCYGSETGSIFVTLSGGTTPYSYIWSDGNTTSDTLLNVEAGEYTITIIDSVYCTYSKTYTITQPQFPMIFTSDIVQNSCYQDSIGAITITAFGGTSPYTYLWSDSTTTSKLTSLVEGEYSVTITDANGCADSSSFNIIASEPLMATYNVTNATCEETEDGQVTINIVNGASPYTFDWSTGDISQNIANVIAGEYSLTITDANNCIDTLTITIDNNSLSCIEIYNAFSPNSDGVNDVWNIKGIENYSTCTVNVYNQWGKKVFSSEGYATPWDGMGTNGKALPADTYFYVIDIGNGDKPYQGAVSIIK